MVLKTLGVVFALSVTSCVPHMELKYYEVTKALRYEKKPLYRFYDLGEAAKLSYEQGRYEDARKFATELRELTPRFPDDWNYGNAIEEYNLVFGRLALRDGDVASAERYLLASAKTDGSPQLDSFGPNMSLARDLLLVGRRDVVLKHLELVRKYWARDPQHDVLDRLHAEDLDSWATEIRAGRIPDFGANLDY